MWNRCQAFGKTGLNNLFQFVWVFVWMILTWGLRIPRSHAIDMDTLVSFEGLPNTQKDWTPRSFPAEVPLMPVSLTLMRWWWQTWDSFKYQGFQTTNVFKQNFVQKLWTQFQAVGYSERDQPTIPHNHLSEDILKTQPFSSFLCASPCLVVEHGS